jgi:hypothetical protein
MTDIHGVWLGLSSGSPLINQITDNGLTASTNIYADEHLLFGHNNQSGLSSENLPTNSPSNFMRQNREWYVQSQGVTTANLNFSLSNGAASVEMLNENQEASFYCLLFRETEIEDFSAIKAGNLKIGDVISFQDVTINNGYYTIAVGDEAIEELLSIDESKTFTSSVYPNPSSGTFTLKHSENVELKVLDLMGKVILEKEASKMHNIELESHSKGIYLVELTTLEGLEITKKIMLK